MKRIVLFFVFILSIHNFSTGQLQYRCYFADTQDVGHTICLGSSTGEMVAESGSTIVQWQKRYEQERWQAVAHSSPTWQDTPDRAGHWQYRVLLRTNDSTSFSEPLALTVAPPPEASFSYQQNGNEVLFENASENAATYFWSFGDGEMSNEENPQHAYRFVGTYTVFLQAANQECTTTTTEEVTVATNEVNIADLLGLNVYPNPNQGHFFVKIGYELLQNNAHLYIFDSEGTLVFAQALETGDETIIMQDVAPGLYFLQVASDSNTHSLTVVVQ